MIVGSCAAPAAGIRPWPHRGLDSDATALPQVDRLRNAGDWTISPVVRPRISPTSTDSTRPPTSTRTPNRSATVASDRDSNIWTRSCQA